MTGLTVKDAAGRVLARFGYAYTPETVRVSAEVKGEMKEFAAAAIGEGGVTAEKTLGNGLAQSFGYDARLRLVESTLAGAAGVVQSHAYEYGPAGNITRIDAQSFGYDRLGHLTAATGGLVDIAYEYDTLGNRLKEIKDGTVTDYVYQDGLLMQAGATSYTYHPDGSLATTTRPGEAWEYAYDIQGRLTTVTLNGAAIGTYGYDQDGLRVWKEENGRTTIYVRDGLEVLYEEDFTGPVTPEATPVATRARVFLGGEIVGLVVNGVEAHYFVNDHLGTTELVTDERGRLRENIVHTPFSERIRVTAYSYLEQRLTETEWLDLVNTTARIEDGQAGPAKVPVEVEELLHRDDTPVLVEDPHYTPAKEYIYHHDDPDVLELKVTSGFKDPETGGYVEYVDLLDLSGKPLGDYRIVLETRKDVGQTGPTENLRFAVYVSKRLRPIESVLRTKPISLGDAIAFSFTPQGTGLEDIVWSISRDNGQTWVEVQTGTLLPVDGATEILLKADLKIVEGHDPPVVTGLDWVFVSERETSERYTFTGKARDATGLYYFGARYYDPEVGRWTTVDPVGDGLNWYAYCYGNPLRYIDREGLWGADLHSGNPYDQYEDTYSIAVEMGFSEIDAHWIGYWDYSVDSPWQGTCAVWILGPLFSDPSWHFDTNDDYYIDSRLVHADDSLAKAADAMKSGNKQGALLYIGKGLHAIQDMSAHGDWDPYAPPYKHPDWYDQPNCDPKVGSSVQPGNWGMKGSGAPLEAIRGFTRYAQFVADTRAYLAQAYVILYGNVK